MVGSQKEDSCNKAGCGRAANETKDFPPLILMVQYVSGNDNDEIIFTEAHSLYTQSVRNSRRVLAELPNQGAWSTKNGNASVLGASEF